MDWDSLLNIKQETHTEDTLSMAALRDLAVVRITGQDAAAFLQAQCCNDITQLSDNGIQLNGYCSPKGRLLAVFHVVKVSGGFLVLLPHSEVERVSKRLRMFVLRADVALTHEATLGVLALRGESLSDSTLSHLLPSAWGEGVAADSLQCARLRDSMPSVIAIGTVDTLDSAIAAFPAAVACSGSWWQRTRLLNGEPVLRAAAVERFVPQMLNMDLIDGLSFSKGCYPGQEIVARTRYLGKQKRRMLLYTGSAGANTPQPGDALHTEASSNAADVVECINTGTELTALAVVRLEHRAEVLRDDSGTRLVPSVLPYDPLEGTDYSAM